MIKPEFIGQSVKYVGGYGGSKSIESAARTCTQTECGNDSDGFVRRLLRRCHLSPFEFAFMDVLVECDRAIHTEIVRHRHFSYNAESSRMCDYRKRPLRFVTKPPKSKPEPEEAVQLLEDFCELCALVYETLLDMGASRDYARKALVMALATRMRMAGNLRCWMEMLPKRLSKAAHAEAREVAEQMQEILENRFPFLAEEKV